jgi:hypothetical protein
MPEEWISIITAFYEDHFKPYMQEQKYPCPDLINFIMWYREIEKSRKIVLEEISDKPDD